MYIRNTLLGRLYATLAPRHTSESGSSSKKSSYAPFAYKLTCHIFHRHCEPGATYLPLPFPSLENLCIYCWAKTKTLENTLVDEWTCTQKKGYGRLTHTSLFPLYLPPLPLPRPPPHECPSWEFPKPQGIASSTSRSTSTNV
jgi:hypothetical protein